MRLAKGFCKCFRISNTLLNVCLVVVIIGHRRMNRRQRQFILLSDRFQRLPHPQVKDRNICNDNPPSSNARFSSPDIRRYFNVSSNCSNHYDRTNEHSFRLTLDKGDRSSDSHYCKNGSDRPFIPYLSPIGSRDRSYHLSAEAIALGIQNIPIIASFPGFAWKCRFGGSASSSSEC
jgi:hypothetical protein